MVERASCKSHQLMRKKRPTARKSRKATWGTSAGAPLMLRASKDPRDRMQPMSARFSRSTVGFCTETRIYSDQ